MGNYATTTTFATLAPDIDFDTATSALASVCIDWAEDKIDGCLSRRYDVSDWRDTSTSVPPEVKSLAEQMGMGYFWEQLSRGGKERLTAGEKLVKRAYDNLMKFADGYCSLTDSSGNYLSTTGSIPGVKYNNDYTPTFGEDDPLNWSVDDDKLDDIADDRDD